MFCRHTVRAPTQVTAGISDSWKKNDFVAGKKCDFEPKEVDLCPAGGSLRDGEGDGNYRNTMFLVSVPRIIPRNYGKSHPCRIVGSGSANTDVVLI